MNRELRAQAFTHGSDIYFNAGKYEPGSTNGKGLLAHELTHVVQQSGALVRKPAVGQLRDQYVQEVGRVVEPVTHLPEPKLEKAQGEVQAKEQPRQTFTPTNQEHAQVFTHNQDVYFEAGKSPADNHLIAHELVHDVHQAGTTTNGGAPAAIQRKEVQKDSDIQGKQDWTTADRVSNTQRWKDACLINLKAVDSGQYVKVVERRYFYKWFYEYTASLGYTTRWAFAAHVVANGAHQIADMDVDHAVANDTLGLANVELQGIMREGNQIIFDNVLPKLKQLLDGGPLKGSAALKWDMQVLAEEQTLIQPMYSRISKETVQQLEYIARKKRFASLGAWWTDEDKVPKGSYNNAGTVPSFDQSDLQNIGDRWKYGMNLGNQFTPGGSGFDPNRDTMPAVSAGYRDGSEFARVDTRANLHQIDAWLNPNRYTRMGPGSVGASTYIQTIINKLSEFEKKQVLSDRSPDGWAYSTQFAQFSFITEAMVKQALPSDPSLASAVATFVAKFKTESTRVQRKYPTPTMGIPF